MRGAFPPLEQLIPHGPPMVLLDEVVAHDERETACTLEIREGSPFGDAKGCVPVWVALEYMAQCAAVRGGLSRSANDSPQVGLLVGSRRLRFGVAEFTPGQQLVVAARDAGRSGGLVSFDCTVRDAREARTCAEGRISVYLRAEGDGEA